MFGRDEESKAIVHFVGHSFVATALATLAVIMCDSALAIALRPFLRGPIFDAGSWLGPLVWWPGLLLGFLVNRVTRHRSACFVWIAGLILLAYPALANLAYSNPHAGSSLMGRLFPRQQADCAASECLDVLFNTWPALNSITYSLGACLAFLVKGRKTDVTEGSL